MDIHAYRAELAAREAERRTRLLSRHSADASVEVESDGPVQSDLFGEDLGSLRYRAECERTGKRGKHFGARHES